MTKTEIDKLREYYKLSGNVTDDEIIGTLQNSLGLVVIRLDKAKKDFGEAMKKIVPNIFKKHL